MTNAELILRLVEMLLKEKEESTKAKEQQEKTKEQCAKVHKSEQGSSCDYPVFLAQKKYVQLRYTYNNTYDIC